MSPSHCTYFGQKIFSKIFSQNRGSSEMNWGFVGHKNTSEPLQDRLNKVTWPNLNLPNCETTHWGRNFNPRQSVRMTSCLSAVERINRLGKRANSTHCHYCTDVFTQVNVTSVFKVVWGNQEVTALAQVHWLLLWLLAMRGWLTAGFTRGLLFAEDWEKTWWHLWNESKLNSKYVGY